MLVQGFLSRVVSGNRWRSGLLGWKVLENRRLVRYLHVPLALYGHAGHHSWQKLRSFLKIMKRFSVHACWNLASQEWHFLGCDVVTASSDAENQTRRKWHRFSTEESQTTWKSIWWLNQPNKLLWKTVHGAEAQRITLHCEIAKILSEQNKKKPFSMWWWQFFTFIVF